MTSAESWTSAWPACSRCAVQLAASAVSEAASWRLTAEALVERYAPRCSGLAGASEWCRMERRTAQSCNSRFSRESGYMQAFVLSPGLLKSSDERRQLLGLVRECVFIRDGQLSLPPEFYYILDDFTSCTLYSDLIAFLIITLCVFHCAICSNK